MKMKLKRLRSDFLSRMVSGLNVRQGVVFFDDDKVEKHKIRLHKIRVFILQHWINNQISEFIHHWCLTAKHGMLAAAFERREENFLEEALSKIRIDSAEEVMKLVLEEWFTSAGIVTTIEPIAEKTFGRTLNNLFTPANNTEEMKLGKGCMYLVCVRVLLRMPRNPE